MDLYSENDLESSSRSELLDFLNAFSKKHIENDSILYVTSSFCTHVYNSWYILCADFPKEVSPPILVLAA